MAGFVCEPCERYFRQFSHYEEHLIHSSRHHYCQPCRRDFSSEEAKQAHLKHSERHMICQWCRIEVGPLALHNRLNHSQCSKCNQWLKDESTLHYHSSLFHSDVYCIPCRRLFSQPDNLKKHKASSAHVPRDVMCPHPDCHSAFISRSTLAAHLEAGACASGISPDEVDRYFSCFDTQQLFIRKNKIYPSGQWDLSPDIFNDYNCPICPKTFKYPQQLDQHLNSPRHRNLGQRPYICPSKGCQQATFSCLSGLLQHRETGDCECAGSHVLPKLFNRLLNVVAQL